MGQPSSPQSQVGPKPQLNPPEPILATNPLNPNLAKNPLDTKNGHRTRRTHFRPWTTMNHYSSHGLWQPTDQLRKHSPQLKQNSFIPPCTPYSRLQEWSQNPTPISKEDSLAHQSGNPWQQSEDHSRIPITWPCRSWVAISFRIIPRAFSEVIQSFNQFSRHQVFQYSLDNSIGPYRCQSINLYVLGPIGPIQSSTVGIKSQSSFSRWPELYWPNSDNTASDPPSRIRISVFHIYWPPFNTWGLFRS
ncbi:hypothetical protein O181_078568 [Austropuccinia psidii MF-1]|uniref:Uncharacterized protein n=1 Tax=Austropuccinia psidii MF-1 TaxID=1389203 RepID=A0A9Q3IES1_9BASI|nr:hypothetical protein [Austropuccinia psidii MF-1]